MTNPYNEKFFAGQYEGSLQSARQIVPYVMELLNCQSVVDVGCGLGTWLSVFHERGIKDLCGMDGAYVNQNQILIAPESFMTTDLRQPQKAHRQFDLAISLEVAEHIPSTLSNDFIDLLTGFSPVVLFSASIPYQDGTDHINEHWLEYWVELFGQRGYVPVDCIRCKFWNNPAVDWWYLQNTILYVSEKHLGSYPQVEALFKTLLPPHSWVHPKLLLHKENRLRQLPRLKEVWKSAFTRTWLKLTASPSSRKDS